MERANDAQLDRSVPTSTAHIQCQRPLNRCQLARRFAQFCHYVRHVDVRWHQVRANGEFQKRQYLLLHGAE